MKNYRSAICVILFFPLLMVSASAQKMGADDVLANHLSSIGTVESVAAVKTRIAVGDAAVKFVSQRTLPAQGRVVIAGESDKLFLGMSFDSNDYPQERISFDGKKVRIASVRLGTRSVLGNFLASNDRIVKESLVGGVLFSSWALLNIESNRGKVSLDGSKKLDGKDTYVLSYSPKGGGDVEIKLYFEKETFRHVRTEYKRIFSAGIGRTPDESSRFSESRLKLTEDFSDFKEISGLTLPHVHRIYYSVSGQNGTTEIEWNFVYTEFAFNQPLDPGTFDDEAE